jgi:hypothetical protein
MEHNKQTYQSDLVREPYPAVSRIQKVYPVKDGENLPNSVTEDVGGFSLCPHYTEKQLRRINRIKRGNHRENQRVRTTERLNGKKSGPKYKPLRKTSSGFWEVKI